MALTTLSVENKLAHLKVILKQMGPTLVAFSGGVDSSFLLAVAAEVLRDQVVALMTLSSSTPPEDISQANSLAQARNVRFLTIQHNELAIPEYAANPTNRCYFCKNSLYEICRREADRLSLRSIVDGVNLDDLQDYRPGLRAAEEYGVIHPLVEAQFNKAEIRHGSRVLELMTWDKPASPCLSSRVPYGTPITAGMLAQIAQGESVLRALGLRELRVRHHGKSARIEIREGDLSKISSAGTIQTISEELKKLGFASVMLDLAGYRSGVFNEGLQKK
ncbi:MAG: ATP-dependent sacrificial sulfur transferase LarE [Deltaproteobacteria bacterium]|nr:ATP-dependent sacrificial sulfur transferase LarE [Deltaproteobacteria bacterium]